MQITIESNNLKAAIDALTLSKTSFPQSEKSIGTLPTTIQDYTVTWESKNSGMVDNSGAIKFHDLVDTKVTLTASISKAGKSGTKNFEVTIGCITEQKRIRGDESSTYTFTSNDGGKTGTLEIQETRTSVNSSWGEKYNYTLNPVTRQIVIQLVAVCENDGVWQNKAAIIKDNRDAAAADPSITFDMLKEALEGIEFMFASALCKYDFESSGNASIRHTFNKTKGIAIQNGLWKTEGKNYDADGFAEIDGEFLILKNDEIHQISYITGTTSGTFKAEKGKIENEEWVLTGEKTTWNYEFTDTEKGNLKITNTNKASETYTLSFNARYLVNGSTN